MRCSKCGNIVRENVNFCANCGAPVRSNTNNRKTILLGAGAVLAVVGGCGMFYSMSTILNDRKWDYTYTPPFTDHEWGFMIALAISIFMTISGIIFLVESKK